MTNVKGLSIFSKRKSNDFKIAIHEKISNMLEFNAFQARKCSPEVNRIFDIISKNFCLYIL